MCSSDLKGFRPCPGAGAMHIASTGFPGHLNGHGIFSAFRLRSITSGRRGRVALDPDEFLDDRVNRIERRETVLGDDAMRRTIRLFQQGIGFRVSCDLFAQQRHFLAGVATEPEVWPERQRIRIKEYPEDAGGGPAPAV